LSSLPLLGALTLACAEGLEPVPFQGVGGTVEYRGELPASTEWVRVAAFQDLPQSIFEFLDFSAISDPLPLDSVSARYLLSLEAGLYRWLPVVWKEENVPLPSGLRIVGWYTGTQDPFGEPDSFLVQEDTLTDGIDMVADFNNPLTLEEALEVLRQ
jgi:hypothetical protein